MGQVFNIGNDREEVTIGDLARRVKDRARSAAARSRSCPTTRPTRRASRTCSAACPTSAKLRAPHRLRAEGAPRRDPRPGGRLLLLRPRRGLERGRVPAHVRRGGEAVVVRGHARAQPGPASRSRSRRAGGDGAGRPPILDAGCGTGNNLDTWRASAAPSASTCRRRPSSSAASRGVAAARARAPRPALPRRRLRRRDVVRRASTTPGSRDDRGRRARDGARAAARGPAPRARPRAEAPVGRARRGGPFPPPLRRGEVRRLLEAAGLVVLRATYCNTVLLPLVARPAGARPPHGPPRARTSASCRGRWSGPSAPCSWPRPPRGRASPSPLGSERLRPGPQAGVSRRAGYNPAGERRRRRRRRAPEDRRRAATHPGGGPATARSSTRPLARRPRRAPPSARRSRLGRRAPAPAGASPARPDNAGVNEPGGSARPRPARRHRRAPGPRGCGPCSAPAWRRRWPSTRSRSSSTTRSWPTSTPDWRPRTATTTRCSAAYGRHMGEIDERHLILQEELVAHVHDLVRRVDLVLAEARAGRG